MCTLQVIKHFWPCKMSCHSPHSMTTLAHFDQFAFMTGCSILWSCDHDLLQSLKISSIFSSFLRKNTNLEEWACTYNHSVQLKTIHSLNDCVQKNNKIKPALTYNLQLQQFTNQKSGPNWDHKSRTTYIFFYNKYFFL